MNTVLILTLRVRGLDIGLKVKCFEKAPDVGGIWHWNCYPGARVDSDHTIYQYSDPELWEDWTWSQRFPGWAELREYYKYVCRKWDLRRDIVFDATVTGARFDEATHMWNITLSGGDRVHARWFVPAMGFAAKKYTPDLKGLDSFRGQKLHTAEWQDGLDVSDKRVAVVGTGATGVQVIQEIASTVRHMTVLQRTPNMALRMFQTQLNKHDEDERKKNGEYATIFKTLRHTTSGFAYELILDRAADKSPEERRQIYEQLWNAGGLRYQLGNFKELFTDQVLNDEIYAFWAEKTRARIHSERDKDLLAPLKPPHPFGVKRHSLETSYYEVYNQTNVDLIDANENPIDEFTESGMRLSDGTVVDLDLVVLATGFDNMTGGFTQLNLVGTDGRTIREHWQDGVHTYLGLGCNKFPNMLIIYGPQSPASGSNGPTVLEAQAESIAQMILHAEKNRISRIEPTVEAEREWKAAVNAEWAGTLYPKAKSWYQGANIPGKKVEALNWAGGLPRYLEIVEGVRRQGYRGFKMDRLSMIDTQHTGARKRIFDTFDIGACAPMSRVEAA